MPGSKCEHKISIFFTRRKEGKEENNFLTTGNIMIKNFKIRFEEWVNKNKDRFNYPPIITKSRKNFFYFRFDNVIPKISGFFDNSGFEISIGIDHQDECWDLVMIFDCYPEKSGDGKYYCSECKSDLEKEGKQDEVKYFYSEDELLKDHVYEPLLEWANRKFTPEHKLCIGGDKNSSTWAAILKDDEIDAKEYNIFIPVLK